VENDSNYIHYIGDNKRIKAEVEVLHELWVAHHYIRACRLTFLEFLMSYAIFQ